MIGFTAPQCGQVIFGTNTIGQSLQLCLLIRLIPEVTRAAHDVRRNRPLRSSPARHRIGDTWAADRTAGVGFAPLVTTSIGSQGEPL